MQVTEYKVWFSSSDALIPVGFWTGITIISESKLPSGAVRLVVAGDGSDVDPVMCRQRDSISFYEKLPNRFAR